MVPSTCCAAHSGASVGPGTQSSSTRSSSCHTWPAFFGLGLRVLAGRFWFRASGLGRPSSVSGLGSWPAFFGVVFRVLAGLLGFRASGLGRPSLLALEKGLCRGY